MDYNTLFIGRDLCDINVKIRLIKVILEYLDKSLRGNNLHTWKLVEIFRVHFDILQTSSVHAIQKRSYHSNILASPRISLMASKFHPSSISSKR